MSQHFQFVLSRNIQMGRKRINIIAPHPFLTILRKQVTRSNEHGEKSCFSCNMFSEPLQIWCTEFPYTKMLLNRMTITNIKICNTKMRW